MGRGLLVLGWILFLAGATLAYRVLGGAAPAGLMTPMKVLFATATASLAAGLWLTIRRVRARRHQDRPPPSPGRRSRSHPTETP